MADIHEPVLIAPATVCSRIAGSTPSARPCSSRYSATSSRVLPPFTVTCIMHSITEGPVITVLAGHLSVSQVKPPNKGHVLESIILFFGSSFGSYFVQSVYNGISRLSFVGRFVLFQSVLYQRFHCIVGNRLATMFTSCACRSSETTPL